MTDKRTCRAWAGLTAGVIVVLAPSAGALGAPAAAPRQAADAPGCRGMTWSVTERDLSRDVLLVREDHVTNAYSGDTDCGRELPILCLKKSGLPVPPGIVPDFYNGWTGGRARLTAPIAGARLTSRAVADRFCAAKYGPGYRIGEHHDGGGGWGWWAQGHGFRTWVTSSAARVNPWDTTTGKALTWTVAGQEHDRNVITYAADFRSDAVRGDIALRVKLGLLCVKYGTGRVAARMTDPVAGASLDSRAEANALCTRSFGSGWRPADAARIGTRLVANGGARMWVAINDQPANPWNSR